MIAIPPARTRPALPAAYAPSPTPSILAAVRDAGEQRRLASYLKGAFSALLVPGIPTIYRILETQETEAIIIDIESFPGEATLLCAQLKASPRFGHIPVILLFSASNARLRIQCLDAGADALLEKPYSKTHLLAQIRNLDFNRARLKEYLALTQPHPEPAPDHSPDSLFSTRLDDLISSNLSNPDLSVDHLAQLMNMSRPTFYRKLKAISDSSPLERINTARIKKAAELIKNSDRTIAQIATMVGFHSRSNFGKAFYKQFQLSPTAFRAKHS
jgi:AraC-like DNA-binding protein